MQSSHTDLSSCRNAGEFGKAVDNLSPMIGWFGGRYFEAQDGKTYQMKELVHALNELAKKEADDSQDFRDAARKVELLDAKGNQKANNRWFGARFMTGLSRALGNLFSKREAEWKQVADKVAKIPFPKGKSPHERIEKNLTFAATQMASQGAKNFAPVLENRGDVEIATEKKVGQHRVGIASTKGRRPAMMDSHLATTIKVHGKKIELYGVFDGFGNNSASEFAKKELPDILKETLEVHCEKDFSEEALFFALKEAFRKLHDLFPAQKTAMGTTATVSLILDGKIITANVGDSRAILATGPKAKQLSEDARLDIPRYREKIGDKNIQRHTQSGPEFVNTNIPFARAVGYRSAETQKGKPLIRPTPKITVVDLPEKCHVVLTTKGLTEVASSEEIAAGVDKMNGSATHEVARSLVEGALKNGSLTNATVLVIEK